MSLLVVHLGRISYSDAVQKQLEILAQVQGGSLGDPTESATETNRPQFAER